jgi:hypothetical protein
MRRSQARGLRNRWFADSSLEERRFEPSVPLAVKTLLRRTFPEMLGCAAAILGGMVAASARSTASGSGPLAADHLDQRYEMRGIERLADDAAFGMAAIDLHSAHQQARRTRRGRSPGRGQRRAGPARRASAPRAREGFVGRIRPSQDRRRLGVEAQRHPGRLGGRGRQSGESGPSRVHADMSRLRAPGSLMRTIDARPWSLGRSMFAHSGTHCDGTIAHRSGPQQNKTRSGSTIFVIISNDRRCLLVSVFAAILENHHARIYVSEMKLPVMFGKGIIVGAVRLALPADLDHARWCEIGADLRRFDRAVAWWVGDWWAFGEYRYGARREITEDPDWQGPAYQTRAYAAAVCRAFEVSRRRETLSFSHHETVAALAPAAQDRWLDEADREGWSRRELRAAVHSAKRPVARCPNHLPVGRSPLR